MAVNVALDIVVLSLVVTCTMFFVSAVTLLIVMTFRGKRISPEGDEIYIGGEGEEVLRHKIPSAIALYWGIVRRAWRKAFEILRNSIHTGILNDWYSFMSVWLGFLLLIALIVIAVYVAG